MHTNFYRDHMKKSFIIKFASLILFALNTNYIHAHGIWFAERSGQLAFIYGEGASDLNTLTRQHKIKSIKGYDAQWESITTSLRVTGPLLLVNSNKALTSVSAVLDNGIWSKKQDGSWIAKGRDVVPNAKLSEHTMKYAVHLKGPLQPITTLKSQTLQIIPVGDKFPTLLGSKVTFKILFEGKPVSHAKIVIDFVNDPDAAPVISNEEGLVTIPLRNQGLNVIAAIYDGTSYNLTKVDKVEHLATLSFVLPHEKE